MKKNSEHYEDLILQHPLFCLLNPTNAQQLIGYAQSESAEAGQIIAVEGEAIDCIYFIVSGSAEVSRAVHTLGKKQAMRISELRKGDIIGLSSEGFVSHTGLHTATVKALNPLQLLKISLYDFLSFLEQPQIKYPNLKKLSEEFLLIQFIRAHHLFSNFSHEKIQTMVKTAKNIKVSAETCLYKEGDIADACYYLFKGEVVLLNLKNSSSTVVKINQMFGDLEFMTDMKRKEAAFAKVDSELLVIEAELVKKFISIQHQSLFQKILLKISGNK
ncbi:MULTISPECIES: cyclic nucleotide-binding domain-containing protein [Legionella]|uniref:Cyclic nucleotide-binding protein n=1 Tax=Legionella steelei TaxID=947033 RepID=A0A0W0ZFJ8_9GAMM|nr:MULTISPECIES: cyclic nucleotide-binding domain-containing protein [Legionella]KTD67738.1 cyclic nucleotide-binding protein [Legionella steelei]MBN9228420.1 cyclic nucleotide-binding domain-containing protein [Legionella steelei]OJW08983.1 MAG: cyclic nucleotide-binding protein [Legionella sp. 39-23]